MNHISYTNLQGPRKNSAMHHKTYISQFFRESSIRICGASNQFPTVYGDGTFPQSSIVVGIYLTPDENEGRINNRLDSVR